MTDSVLITLTSFNDKERQAIRELQGKRQFSHVVSIALHEYLQRVNPDTNDINSLEDETTYTVKNNDDIDKYIKNRATENPSKSGYILKITRERLERTLAKYGQFYISKENGVLLSKEGAILPKEDIPHTNKALAVSKEEKQAVSAILNATPEEKEAPKTQEKEAEG